MHVISLGKRTLRKGRKVLRADGMMEGGSGRPGENEGREELAISQAAKEVGERVASNIPSHLRNDRTTRSACRKGISSYEEDGRLHSTSVAGWAAIDTHTACTVQMSLLRNRESKRREARDQPAGGQQLRGNVGSDFNKQEKS
jgi:hypothetical protein